MTFTVEKTDPAGRARTGVISTAHGRVPTPVFCPVATRGAVRCLASEQLAALGFRMLLANAYHLSLRPGAEVIAAAGGLHRFMNWPRALLTDSGGYQVFSLADTRVEEAGAVFRSVYDGRRHRVTPAGVVAVQAALGADIIMPLDEPVPWPAPRERVVAALERTSRWAVLSKEAWRRETARPAAPALFGIVQGGTCPELRRRSAEEITALDLPGYALGGFCLGEPRPEMNELVAGTAALLPADRPRYLMGVGSPLEILAAIEAGVDIFDCVLPTHIARNGCALTSRGRLIVRDAASREAAGPVDPACDCFVCRGYSRAYLRHLVNTKELTVLYLLTYHNLYFLARLLTGARRAIAAGGYADFAAAFRAAWSAGERPRADGRGGAGGVV